MSVLRSMLPSWAKHPLDFANPKISAETTINRRSSGGFQVRCLLRNILDQPALHGLATLRSICLAVSFAAVTLLSFTPTTYAQYQQPDSDAQPETVVEYPRDRRSDRERSVGANDAKNVEPTMHSNEPRNRRISTSRPFRTANKVQTGPRR